MARLRGGHRLDKANRVSGAIQRFLDTKSAYLEIWSDFLGSIAVIGGAGVIWAAAWRWVDPMLGIGIAYGFRPGPGRF